LKIGDIVKIQHSDSEETVGNAEIITKSVLTFKDMLLTTAVHESYRNKEQQREVMSGYYAYLDRPIDDNDVFIEYGFRLVNPQ